MKDEIFAPMDDVRPCVEIIIFNIILQNVWTRMNGKLPAQVDEDGSLMQLLTKYLPCIINEPSKIIVVIQ